jgi:hypothetical protein
VKLRVSLPAEVVDAIDGYDAYTRGAGLPSRSAVVHRAVRALRNVDLEPDDAETWTDGESRRRGSLVRGLPGRLRRCVAVRSGSSISTRAGGRGRYAASRGGRQQRRRHRDRQPARAGRGDGRPGDRQHLPRLVVPHAPARDETGLPVDSQAEQVRSVPVGRVGAVLAVVPAALLDDLDDARRLHRQL